MPNPDVLNDRKRRSNHLWLVHHPEAFAEQGSERDSAVLLAVLPP
jgi:hypothetical protein